MDLSLSAVSLVAVADLEIFREGFSFTEMPAKLK